jgi:hypothetical protein
VRSWRRSLSLLAGRRLPLVATADAVLVLWALYAALLGGGEPSGFFVVAVLVPLLLLALPLAADAVAVERRAGCLDVALAAPRAEAYFLRRIVAVALVASAQGSTLVLLWWSLDPSFPLLTVLAQGVLVTVFVMAVALFWAVRLRTPGGVWLAALATVAVFGRWFFFDPVPRRLSGVAGPLLPGGWDAVRWAGTALVLATASVLFFLYARRRLRRPELLLR